MLISKIKNGNFQHNQLKKKIVFFQNWLFLGLNCFFICLTLFNSNVVGQSLVEKTSNDQEIEQFLYQIAEAETQEWNEIVRQLPVLFPNLMLEFSLKNILNELKEYILESQNVKLIKLFNRAVRNHDALSPEKAEPVVSYYKHYEAPPFFIPNIELLLDVQESVVDVKSHLVVMRNSQENSLILDGKDQVVNSVFLNGKKLLKNQYKITLNELIILDLPQDDTFEVTIHNTINPYINESLEGMYQCGNWLTTQCESEGARRIFFTMDRPDVLSRISTTILADQKKYPYRLSNGHCIKEEVLENGRTLIHWEDPFPKPSYLFACVLGDFSQLTDFFTTRSGKNVELQIYVEKGKESRAKYALFALKKAMEFDELFFDREYDLSTLMMVGIPDFNSGAMENKGLMIFNDIRLLVDSESGTDKSFRDVASVIGHEYFHNWSGNRVTIRNWFEIALKEAFTDLRAMLFSEWLFGSAFIRPKSVLALREHQFPEETSEKGHSIIVESYVDPHSIYDSTTYTKGREVFRTLKNYLDMLIPDGFREVQNLYFERYDGQAVTFRELLFAGNDVLKKLGRDLSLFERWFHQPGTPVLNVAMNYDLFKREAHFVIEQSCRHPRTGQEQKPFPIPFTIELLGKNGEILHPKFSFILEDEKTTIILPSMEEPTPLFLHGFSAPVILNYSYSLENLECIVKYSDDSFCRWEAAQNYSIEAFKQMRERIKNDPTIIRKSQIEDLVFSDLHKMYKEALESDQISPLAKAQILEIPSLRTLSQALNDYDFEQLTELRLIFSKHVAYLCKRDLENLLEKYPIASSYRPHADQMEIRELRYAVLRLLMVIDEDVHEKIIHQYREASNFDDFVTAFNLSLRLEGASKEFVNSDFYQKWKNDKAVFNFWLSSQATLPDCTIEDLRRLETVEGYDHKNPNHIRSLLRTFIGNLRCYHHSSGNGYTYIVDKILEISKFNPQLAHNYIAVPAFLDFEKLPKTQQVLMAKELKRLNCDDVPAQTRDLVERMLEHYYNDHK